MERRALIQWLLRLLVVLVALPALARAEGKLPVDRFFIESARVFVSTYQRAREDYKSRGPEIFVRYFNLEEKDRRFMVKFLGNLPALPLMGMQDDLIVIRSKKYHDIKIRKVKDLETRAQYDINGQIYSISNKADLVGLYQQLEGVARPRFAWTDILPRLMDFAIPEAKAEDRIVPMTIIMGLAIQSSVRGRSDRSAGGGAAPEPLPAHTAPSSAAPVIIDNAGSSTPGQSGPR